MHVWGTILFVLLALGLLGLLGAGLAYAWRTFRPGTRVVRVLIITVHPFETAAVRSAALAHPGRIDRPWRRSGRRFDRDGIEDLGTFSNARLVLAQIGAGGSVVDARHLYGQVRADYVIFTGVCRGLHPDRQHAGDIILGNHVLHVGEKARPDGTDEIAPLIVRRDVGWTTLPLIARFRIHSPPQDR